MKKGNTKKGLRVICRTRLGNLMVQYGLGKIFVITRESFNFRKRVLRETCPGGTG
jgi:hypothetical protein